MEQPVPAASLVVAALTGDPVVRIDPGASLRDVARAMVDDELGALVVGEGDRPGGIVTERDLARALAGGSDPDATTAAEVANRDLIWCDASATVAEVARHMMDRYVRHLLVEQDGRLMGVISARDLLGVYATDGDDTDG